MNVNPGEMNKRIKIMATTRTVDEDGFQIESEIVQHECWAKVSNTSGTELTKANAEFVEVKTRFMIRYTAKVINEDMTILFQGNTYDIAYLNNYGFSNEYMEIYGTLRKVV